MKYKPKKKNVTKLKHYLNKITDGNINRKYNKRHL